MSAFPCRRTSRNVNARSAGSWRLAGSTAMYSPEACSSPQRTALNAPKFLLSETTTEGNVAVRNA